MVTQVKANKQMTVNNQVIANHQGIALTNKLQLINSNCTKSSKLLFLFLPTPPPPFLTSGHFFPSPLPFNPPSLCQQF